MLANTIDYREPDGQPGRQPQTIRTGDWALMDNRGQVVRVFDHEHKAYVWLESFGDVESEPYSLGVYE